MEIQVAAFEHNGNNYRFVNTKQAPIVIKEIFSDNYHALAANIPFRPGDVIMDVGANEGMFSILMAKTYPGTRIIALEPVPATYEILLQNLKINEVTNVEPYNVGLGRPSQDAVWLIVSKDFSGGSTRWCTFNPDHHTKVVVHLLSFDDAFKLYNVNKCMFMKMDIEGMEYEVLYHSTRLGDVENFAAEFHTNRKLDFESRRVDGLINWVAKRTRIIHVEICGMAE